MNAIQITNLTRTFKTRTAVDHLNLNIAQGECFALLGPNGAGKTTAIRMLCCLLSPTSGDALIMGESITSNPSAAKRHINLSPQETAVAPLLTLQENLELIARLYGSSKEDARAKALASLEKIRMADRAKDKAKSLSGGMQRRLSIAMALITEPDVVFLDEPTLGLDVRARRELWRLLMDLKGHTTVILTTHYLEEAEALADRIGILFDGKLQALGTAEELKQETGKDSFEDAFLSLTGEEDYLS